MANQALGGVKNVIEANAQADLRDYLYKGSAEKELCASNI